MNAEISPPLVCLHLRSSRLLHAGPPARSLVLAGLMLMMPVCARGESDGEWRQIAGWLSKRDSIHTLTGSFEEIRRMPALKLPLQRPGRFWFKAPDKMRMEIGNPVQIAAVRSGDAVKVYEARKSTTKEYLAATPNELCSINPTLFLMSPPPRDVQAFQRAFDLTELKDVEGGFLLRLRIRDPQAARFVSEARIMADAANGLVKSFSITMRNGAEIEVRFSDVFSPKTMEGNFSDPGPQ